MPPSRSNSKIDSNIKVKLLQATSKPSFKMDLKSFVKFFSAASCALIVLQHLNQINSTSTPHLNINSELISIVSDMDGVVIPEKINIVEDHCYQEVIPEKTTKENKNNKNKKSKKQKQNHKNTKKRAHKGRRV